MDLRQRTNSESEEPCPFETYGCKTKYLEGNLEKHSMTTIEEHKNLPSKQATRCNYILAALLAVTLIASFLMYYGCTCEKVNASPQPCKSQEPPSYKPQPKQLEPHEIVNEHKPTTESILPAPDVSSTTSTLPAIFDLPNFKEYKESGRTWVSEAFYAAEKSDAYYFSIKFVNNIHGSLMYACFYMLGNKEDKFPREADIILQLVNQKNSHYGHHVLRLFNMQFRHNPIQMRIETGYAFFLNFSESDQHFIRKDHLKFRVVTIEFHKNRIPPVTFAMCQYQEYRSHTWKTFPFYSGPDSDYRFVIHIVAQNCSQVKRAPFSIIAYQLNDFPEVFNDGTIIVEFMNTKNKHYDRVTKLPFIEHEDVRRGVSAKPFSCEELENNYVDYDCFLFRVNFQFEV